MPLAQFTRDVRQDDFGPNPFRQFMGTAPGMKVSTSRPRASYPSGAGTSSDASRADVGEKSVNRRRASPGNAPHRVADTHDTIHQPSVKDFLFHRGVACELAMRHCRRKNTGCPTSDLALSVWKRQTTCEPLCRGNGSHAKSCEAPPRITAGNCAASSCVTYASRAPGSYGVAVTFATGNWISPLWPPVSTRIFASSRPPRVKPAASHALK